MSVEYTTVAVQRYLDELGDLSSTEPVVRALLDRSVRRLEQLCAGFLYRRYPRLTRPPTNLVADELLSAVVERLLKALREARPKTTRQFFALACQHIRWELNDMARRLDERPAIAQLDDEMVAAPPDSASGPTADASRILRAIEHLSNAERESFDLVRIQGLSQAQAAEVLGVSPMTVNRRLHRALKQLADSLADLYPDDDDPNPPRPEQGLSGGDSA
jgi:RNA polymerase sigma-70 factor (ECF subfamily)